MTAGKGVTDKPRLVTDEQRLEFLTLLVEGATFEQIAAKAGVSRGQVEAAATFYGHPSQELMRQALGYLQDRVTVATVVAALPKVRVRPPRTTNLTPVEAMRARHDRQRNLCATYGVTAAELRSWARGRGLQVRDQGLLAQAVLDAYETSRT